MPAAERELRARAAGARAALGAVEFGQVQQQVTAVGAERVQRADLGQPFGGLLSRAGPLPEVQQ